MKHIYHFLISCLAIVIYSQTTYAQLSDEERNNLKISVLQDYMLMGGNGCEVYKTKKHYVLVEVVESSSYMDSNLESRAAIMRARQDMVEFLNGVKHESITCYEVESRLADNEENSMMQNNSKKRASTTQSFTDKILEKACAKMEGGVQSLAKFQNKQNKNVYVYYLVLSKAKAKKKY